MEKIVFLILRRMRAPLLVIIAAYTISIIGMVLIPGVDEQGNPVRMGFFHAIYFVSYMATTIGFGEIPYAFTDAQRMWTVVAIHLTVIAWLYAIGKILALIGEPAFRQAVVENAFTRSVRRMREPFYVVCGYGDTGSLLVRALSRRGLRSVVVDWNQDRVNELELEDLGVYVPGLCADAARSLTLKEAGLLHSHCVGVVALTDDDAVNLKIAITTKLLRPGLPVVCRAETHDAVANMDSFGTDHIINPFDTFAERLALVLNAPGAYLLHEWLTGVPGTPLSTPLYPPHGTWVLCGYGRFGKAVKARLDAEGVETRIIELDPVGTGCEGEFITGRGTEAATLLEAGIEKAAGVVGGTDDDSNNLSIMITARDLKKDLFTVARQNRHDNDEIFQAAHLDLVMQRSEIIARDLLALLTTPLLNGFLHRVRGLGNEWSNQLVSRISAVTGELVPEIWSYRIDMQDAPAVYSVLQAGETVEQGMLQHDARNREERLPCLALALKRDGDWRLLPEDETPLVMGDELLFCGAQRVAERMSWALQNNNALHYIRSGEERPSGVVWRWLAARRARA